MQGARQWTGGAQLGTGRPGQLPIVSRTKSISLIIVIIIIHFLGHPPAGWLAASEIQPGGRWGMFNVRMLILPAEFLESCHDIFRPRRNLIPAVSTSLFITSVKDNNATSNRSWHIAARPPTVTRLPFHTTNAVPVTKQVEACDQTGRSQCIIRWSTAPTG
jgi:hypothetical protein